MLSFVEKRQGCTPDEWLLFSLMLELHESHEELYDCIITLQFHHDMLYDKAALGAA